MQFFFGRSLWILVKEILSAEKFHEILNGMPELKDKSISNWDIYDMNPLLDSSNMDVED